MFYKVLFTARTVCKVQQHSLHQVSVVKVAREVFTVYMLASDTVPEFRG